MLFEGGEGFHNLRGGVDTRQLRFHLLGVLGVVDVWNNVWPEGGTLSSSDVAEPSRRPGGQLSLNWQHTSQLP